MSALISCGLRASWIEKQNKKTARHCVFNCFNFLSKLSWKQFCILLKRVKGCTCIRLSSTARNGGVADGKNALSLGKKNRFSKLPTNLLAFYPLLSWMQQIPSTLLCYAMLTNIAVAEVWFSKLFSLLFVKRETC